MSDTMMFSLMLAGVGFIGIYFVSAALGFFVALNARPSRRAAWNVGIPYLIGTAITAYLLAVTLPASLNSSSPVDPWTAPLLMAPGALVTFLLRLWHFRSAWVEDVSELPDGVSLANDDWRAGIVHLLLFVALMLALALWRFVLRGTLLAM